MKTPAELSEACLAYYPLKADTLDYSIHANDATAMGSLSYVPGRFGQAVSIAGTPGNGVQVPSSVFSQSGLDFTLAVWVCLSADESVTNGWAVIAGGLICDNDNGLLDYQIAYQLDGETTIDDFSFEASLAPGVWTHLAVSFDQSQQVLTCYVNGEATATYRNAIPAGALALLPFGATPYIGCAGPSSDQTSTFNGAIGDVMLFSLAFGEDTLDLLDGTLTYDFPATNGATGIPWLAAAVCVVVFGIIVLYLNNRAPQLRTQVQSEPSASPPFNAGAAAQKIMQICGSPLPLQPTQVTRAQAGIPDYAKVKLDVGGCGYYLYDNGSTVTACGFSDAINLNCVTTTGSDSKPPNQAIPNLLLIQNSGGLSCNSAAALPFANDTVDYVTLQNSPLTDLCVTEIARVLKPKGEVGLWIDATAFGPQIAQLTKLLGYKQRLCTGQYANLDEMVLAYQALMDGGIAASPFLYQKILLYP